MPQINITADKRVLDAIRDLIQNSEAVNEILSDNYGIEYDETHELTGNIEIEELA